MIPLFSTTSAGVEQVIPNWILLDTITTDSNISSMFNVTIDSSNGLPANSTGRLIFNIVADEFKTDQQIASINVDSSTTVFDFTNDNEGFEQVSIQGADLNDYLSAQADDAARNTFYNGLTFTSIATSTTGNGQWLRDSAGTASTGTGVTFSGFYIYFEASSSTSTTGGHPIGGLARSPEFSVDGNPSMVINMGRYGAGFNSSAGTFGRLEIWWKPS